MRLYGFQFSDTIFGTNGPTDRINFFSKSLIVRPNARDVSVLQVWEGGGRVGNIQSSNPSPAVSDPVVVVHEGQKRYFSWKTSRYVRWRTYKVISHQKLKGPCETSALLSQNFEILPGLLWSVARILCIPRHPYYSKMH